MKLGWNTKFILITVGIFALQVRASAASLDFKSGDDQVAVLELYTSEGCDSCPPAEAWFSRLKENSGLWRKFIPVVFHVNYWDYLGWKDDLASQAFTDRQKAYASEWASPQIYTPGVVLDGKDWRSWREVSTPTDLPAKKVGELRVRVDAKDQMTTEIAVEFSSKASDGEYIVTVARLGIGVTREIKAGENRGKKLRHDFVVMHLESRQAVRTFEKLSAKFKLEKPRVTEVRADRRALVAWISKRGSQKPIQAVGGYWN